MCLGACLGVCPAVAWLGACLLGFRRAYGRWKMSPIYRMSSHRRIEVGCLANLGVVRFKVGVRVGFRVGTNVGKRVSV